MTLIAIDEWETWIQNIKSQSAYSGTWKPGYGDEEEWIASLLSAPLLPFQQKLVETVKLPSS